MAGRRAGHFFGVGAVVLCMFLHRGTRVRLRSRDYSVIKSRFERESQGWLHKGASPADPTCLSNPVFGWQACQR